MGIRKFSIFSFYEVEKIVVVFMYVFIIYWFFIIRFDFKEISLVDFNYDKFYSIILLLNIEFIKYIGKKGVIFSYSFYLL